MTRHSRWLQTGLALAVLAAIPRLAVAQTNWRATVGAQSRDLGRQALAFLPNEIWIHVGDSISWTFNVDELHTVTFLTNGQVRPPFPVGCPGFSTSPATFDGTTCVTSAPVTAGTTFTVNFTAAGNYKLVCLLHENMTGAVHVLHFNEPLPHGQGFYDRQAMQQARDMLSDVDTHKRHGHDHHMSGDHVTARAGSEISATPGGSSTLSVVRFDDDVKVIHVGDTVEWGNDDPVTPHTITFGEEPEDNPQPPSANVTVDEDGARHATINSTSDNVHSGFIVAAPQERLGLPQTPLGTTRFRVTFTHAGVFPYICALHDDLGMKGKIIVLP
jgi:plastocyanin